MYPFQNKMLKRRLGKLEWKVLGMGELAGYIGHVEMCTLSQSKRNGKWAVNSVHFPTTYSKGCRTLRGAKNTAQWHVKLFFTNITRED